MSARVTRLPARAGNRAILYLRQSTYREESISLDVQEQAAREHCKRNGYDVVGVEADPGITGRSWKRRAGVQAALGAVENGTADVIVVWRWSRLSRSRRDWAVAADQADLAGGRIESATEPNDQTAAGRFARGVMTELAAFESERIGEQWEEARQHRVKRGLPSTGGERFGYRIVDGRYELDATEGPVLAEMYRLYLAGHGSAHISRTVNALGITYGRTAHSWAYQDVLRVMDSGFAAGLLVKTPPRPKDRPDAPAPTLPVWEREFRPGGHPTLIDPETWAAYVAARRERTRTRTRRASLALSGLVRCTDCGGPMHAGAAIKGRRIYKCARGSVRADVRSVTISAHLLEAAVERWLFDFADDVVARAAVIERSAEHGERVDLTARRAQQRLQRAEERLVQLTLRLADGTLSETAYRLAAETVEAEQRAAREHLQAAARNPVREAAPAALPRDLARLWPGMTPEAQNAVLRPLIRRIEVRPAAHHGETADRWRILPAWESDPDVDPED